MNQSRGQNSSAELHFRKKDSVEWGSFWKSQQNLLFLGVVLVASFLVYLPSLQNGFVNCDDPIYIYENPESYIAINRGYCDICEPANGGGIFMEYKIDGAWGAYQKATDAEDVYLRLESSNDMISGYYAFEEGQWERLGRFGNFFEFSRVGIGVSNVNATSDLVGMFDYFEITVP